MICSIGDVFGGCTRFCVFSRVFIFLRIFAEFSRKFARKVHEEPHRLGLRFFFYTIAKVFRRFQVARDSFSLLKPRKLRSRFSKFRIFALIVLLRLEANFEFQKCAVTSPTFLLLFVRAVQFFLSFRGNRPLAVPGGWTSPPLCELRTILLTALFRDRFFSANDFSTQLS